MSTLKLLEEEEQLPSPPPSRHQAWASDAGKSANSGITTEGKMPQHALYDYSLRGDIIVFCVTEI